VIGPVAPVEPSGRPFWSVMVPSYNAPDLLARTLESVLAQDPGDRAMQIEVVDDASEGSDVEKVVDRIGGGRVGLHVQPVNVGASANFTECVRRSLGTWVHILHSDDVVLPGFYERYGAQIGACPDAVMVAGRTVDVDGEERRLGLTPEVSVAEGYLRDPVFTIIARNPLRFVSTVVSRRAFETVGGFHPELFHACDWEMWARLAASGPVGWVDEALGMYRNHNHSDSRRLHHSTAYLDDCLHAVQVMAGRLPPPRRRAAVRAGSRDVAGYALHVGRELVDTGEFQLALANAVRAVRMDPSAATVGRAATVARAAAAGGLFRVVSTAATA
jgi:GT2 family glycosyltransferase